MPRSFIRALAILAISSTAGTAHAEITAQVGGGFRYEDNLFRITPQAAAIRGVRRSDQIYNATAGLDAALHPGAFDVQLKVQAGHQWYNRNSDLNNTNYSGDLSVIRDDEGFLGFRLKALVVRRLSSFSDIGTGIGNIQTLQTLENQTTFAITPELRVVVTPLFARSRNTAATVEANDFDRYGGGIGFGYFSPIGNYVSLTVSRQYTDGVRDRPATIGGVTVNAPIDVVDTAVNLRLRYDPSVFTSISGELSYVDRNDQSLIDSDYHGPAGRVSVNFHPTDSFTIDLTVGRRLEAQSSVFVDALKNDYVDLSALVRLTDRIDLNAAAGVSRRKFNVSPVALGTFDTVQKNYGLDLGATYRPLDNVELGLSGSYDKRRVNLSGNNYSAKAVIMSARYVFGDKAVK